MSSDLPSQPNPNLPPLHPVDGTPAERPSSSGYSFSDDPRIIEAVRVATDDRATKGPRWWTTLAVVCVSGLVFIVASAIMTLLAFVIVHGELNAAMFSNPNAMKEVLASRTGLFVMVVTPQLMLVIPSIVAAKMSPVETKRRLGLVRGNWPVWTWFAAAAATPLVGLVSSVIVGMFLAESDSLKMMSEVFRDHGKTGFVIPLALMIGATPAICEELLFRGYVQTRLTRSVGPALGILIASLLFAVFHMDFVHVIAVLPLGLFLGWIAWRSGSLFPAMIGHFVNNVISVVAVVYAPEDQADVLAVPAMMVSLTIIGLGMIGMAVVIAASVLYGRPSEFAEDAPDAGESAMPTPANIG